MIDAIQKIKERNGFLESKCAYLTELLEQTILNNVSATETSRIEIVEIPQQAELTVFSQQSLSKSEELIMSAFLVLLGRPASKEDLDFYLIILNRHGRLRLIRDIFISHESISINRLPRLVVSALRSFWKA